MSVMVMQASFLIGELCPTIRLLCYSGHRPANIEWTVVGSNDGWTERRALF